MTYNVQLYFGEPIYDFASEFLNTEAQVMLESIKRFLEDMRNRNITLDFNKVIQTMALGFLSNFRECLENGLLDYTPNEDEEGNECDVSAAAESTGEDDEILLIPASMIREKVRAIMKAILGCDEC